MEKSEININAKGRIDEVDFLKCIFILLMIAFHLTYIGNNYPYIKQVVYTFHMPAFLIISGYFASTKKNPRQEIKYLFWLFIPYAIMEIGYTILAAFLPISDHIDDLSPLVIARHVLLTPIGPYWYLHTLILCSGTYYILLHKISISRFIILGMFFLLYSEVLHITSFANECYFLAGAAIKCSGTPFLRFFRSSPLSLIPIIIAISYYPQDWNKANIIGILMVYFVISLLLFIYPYIHVKLKQLFLFIGRNTLVIYIFSPIFTVLTKLYQSQLITLDHSGFLFLLVSVAFTVIGSLLLTKVIDYLHISNYLFGKTKVLSSIHP